jgi:polyhydroxybutyrate depolymerase
MCRPFATAVLWFVSLLSVVPPSTVLAQPTTAPAALKVKPQLDPKVAQREWLVDGVKRAGTIVSPTLGAHDASLLPVLFVFHGHGGSVAQVRRQSSLDGLLPEAITVYLQGLPTPGLLSDPEGKRAGWQSAAGDQHDRDLKFFDAVWADLQREMPVDPKRLFAYGHSNGGRFVFVVWAERGELFNAFVTSGSVPPALGTLKPKRALHVAGRADALVRFGWQARWIERARGMNGCDAEPRPWAERGERHSSTAGTPFYTLLYDGAHRPPPWSYPLVARFLREED